MIPASAEYKAYEAMTVGATPVVRATFLPYLWPNGINATGEFNECAYVAPDRIQADYHGFTGGSWISPVLTSNLQVTSSSAIITWDWNSPGFDSLLYYRGAIDETALSAAAWTLVNQGDTIQVYPYYQFKLTIEGYRAWAEEDATGDREYDLEWFAELLDDYSDTSTLDWDFEAEFDIDQFYALVNAAPDEWDLDLSVLGNDFTAWAVDADPDTYQSYASDTNVADDVLTYIEDIDALGEFAIVRDIEEAGSLTQEAPDAFDDLVAGEHSGLLLNNRQGSFVGGVWIPAPLFSPNKSSFFLSQQDWYNLELKIELGWNKGGWFESGFLEDEWLGDAYSDVITLFHGKVKKWGPVTRAVDSPNNVEIYATDFIMDCLQKRICLPSSDGTPAPLTYGEFLAQAEPIIGWSPAPLSRSAYFANNNYDELDIVVASGGGDFSLNTPGVIGTRAFQCQTTGAGQAAYGGINSTAMTGDLFATGTMTFTEIPIAPLNQNMVLFEILAAGTSKLTITVDDSGNLYATLSGTDPAVSEQCDFNILGYEDVPLTFGILLSPVRPGYANLWINGDEVLAVKNYMAYLYWDYPLTFRFGTQTTLAENWTVVFENIEVRNKYYLNAFQVTGGPFESIGPVYVDSVAQPPSKKYTSNSMDYTQNLERFPLYGMVQFSTDVMIGATWDDDFEISGDVMVRIVEDGGAGGRHALYIIEDLLDRAGLTTYIDTTALAAAYGAVPSDIINARFEGETTEAQGLKDYASLGVPISDALKEICSRCLYWIFIDAGSIKIVPYTGTALITPTDPLQIFTASNKWENSQVIDLENINSFVTVIYGWYERNPTLHYVAGTQVAGGQGTGLDFSWDGPVACENRLLAVSKADLLLKYLSAQEFIDPVTTTLSGARLELMSDVINLSDDLLSDAPINYLICGKEVGLDQGNRITSLRLIRFLGE